MLEETLIGIVVVAITVVIHAVGTTRWIRYVTHRFAGHDGQWKQRDLLPVLTSTAIVLLTLHIVEVMLWAVVYELFLPAGELQSFEETVYFSVVTFTTLGYGDITLGPEWRILSGIEALAGILLFAVVQRSWKYAAEKKWEDRSRDGGCHFWMKSF